MEAATARLRGAPAEPAAQRTLDRLRSDRRLAERYHEGDEAAFARIYERHRARVFAICLGVLGSREDAQDALQEVFASVAAELRREPPRELRPWIARVARNAAIDAARTRRPPSNGDDEAVDARASDGTLQAVERRDDLRDLLIGLRDLPEQQRTALVMRELGGDSYADIGAALGVDETAVRGLIARARLSLRARIAAQAMACEVVRQRLAAETDGRRRPSSVRRHLRECDGCHQFSAALRADARTLRGLAPTGAGFGLLALVTAWRAPKAVVAGGLLAKGALSSGAAQVAVVCVAALCAAGGAEELVKQQRHGSGASASAEAGSLAAPENASARTRPASRAGGGNALAGGGAALPVVAGALDRAGANRRLRTAPTTTVKTRTTTARRTPVSSSEPARRTTQVTTPPAERGTRGSGGSGDVERLGGNGSRGNRGGDGGGYRRDAEQRPERRPERVQGSGDGAGANPRPWQGQGDTGAGRRPRQPAAAQGGGVPQVRVPQVQVPQVTAPAPVQAPAPETAGGDGS
jgi:RNA polymerase sigma factor (sigma-70 family)